MHILTNLNFMYFGQHVPLRGEWDGIMFDKHLLFTNWKSQILQSSI